MNATDRFALGPRRFAAGSFFALLVLFGAAFASMGTAWSAPTFQAAGTEASGTGDVNVTWPAHQAGDVALLFVESTGGEVATLDIPAGFVAVANSPQATGTTTNGTRITVFWARATSASMANPRVNDPGNHAYARILTYRGVIETGNPWDVTGGNVKAAASTSLTVTGVTTTVADTLVVQVASHDRDNTGAHFSGQTNANLTGINERVDAGTTSGNGGGLAVWDGVKATASATGNTSVNLSNSVVNAFLTIALRPGPPVVNSIARAGADPASAGDAVSWTVVFNTSVTGVDASDFALVLGGGATGASITSVTGSGTTWTVTANSGTAAGTLGLNLVDNDSIVSAGGLPLGGAGAGNGDFTGEVYTLSPPFCSPPSNVPAGVTVECVCDTFGRASLNPSTIFGANWIVSRSDSTSVVPYINATSGYLRLTENTGNNAKAATVPGIFPAAGNYISVEFQHFAYGGSGADGIAVTLSDYSVPAVPGAFGGSLGYAQKTGAACPTLPGTPCPGFAGGWVGIGIDEFGNYQNPTEGRVGGPGARVDSVGVRGSGSGSGTSEYPWVAGTGTLAPGIDNAASATPAPGHYYQVIVDARNAENVTPETWITVNRSTGGAYAAVIPAFDMFATNPSQAAVPDNWQISFTGSTGGATNIHEIGGLRICAQTVAPPSGGTASGFNAIDEGYATPPATPAVQNFLNGHIYLKLVNTPFKLWVAALDNNQVLTTYAAGGNRNVAVKLVDNTDGACILDSTQANYCNATCTNKTAVSGGSQTITFTAGDAGKKISTDFTLNAAYKNLVAIMSEGGINACSTDAFAVRPTGLSLTATDQDWETAGTSRSLTTGATTHKAGRPFTMQATALSGGSGVGGYAGTPKINSGVIALVSPATFPGTVSGSFAAGSGSPSVATGTNFTYSEVGSFQLPGFDPASNTTSPRGLYEGVNVATECAPPVTLAQCDTLRSATWVGVDSVTAKGDCVQNNYSNTRNASGKYGCSVGLMAGVSVGRFVPDYFDVTRSFGCPAGNFTYSGQPFSVSVTAYNTASVQTRNFQGTLAKDVTISLAGNAANFTNNTVLATAFTNGAGSRADVAYTFPVKETEPLTPTVLPTPPSTPLRGVDEDGVSSLGHIEEQIHIRSGRIQIQNAFGSELLDLAMPMRAQYYTTNGWVTNTDDNCTLVTMSAFTNPQGNLAVNETCVQDTGSPGLSGQGCAAAGPMAERFREGAGFGGDFNHYLRAPGAGNDGSVDVTLDLSPTGLNMRWLQSDWDGVDQGGDGNFNDDNPMGRATFGIYRGSPRHIHIRERF